MAWTFPKASATAATPASIPAPSGTAAATQRQQGAGAPEQEGGEQRAGQQRHHADVGADRRRRFGREDAGAGEQEPRLARFGRYRRRARKAATASRWASASRPAPRVRARSSARGGSAPGGEPGAVARLDAAFGEPGPGEAEEGAGRVGEAEAGEQRRGGAAEAVKQGFELRPERCGFEAFGPGVRGKQVAVAEQQRLFGLAEAGGAVAHEGEAVGGAQRGGGLAGDARELVRRARLRSRRGAGWRRRRSGVRRPGTRSRGCGRAAGTRPGRCAPRRLRPARRRALPAAGALRAAAPSSRPGRRNGRGAVQVTRCTAYSILPVPSRRPAATNRLVFSQR